MSMFGKGARSVDQSAMSIKPGINSGFTSSELFVEEEGSNWKAWDFKFEGAITIKDRIFLPKERTVPGQYDPDNLAKYNARLRAKAEKAKKMDDHKDMTMPEYLKQQFDQDMQNFDKQLRMYAFTFYPDGSPEREAAENTLQGFDSTADFVAALPSYIDSLRALVPQDLATKSFDLLIGKKADGQYLEFPKAIWVTGRYVKLTGDTTRELIPSKKFIDSHMGGAVAEQAATPVAKASDVKWS